MESLNPYVIKRSRTQVGMVLSDKVSHRIQQEVAQADSDVWTPVDYARWAVDWALRNNLHPHIRSLLLSQRTVYGVRSAAQFEEDSRLFSDEFYG